MQRSTHEARSGIRLAWALTFLLAACGEAEDESARDGGTEDGRSIDASTGSSDAAPAAIPAVCWSARATCDPRNPEVACAPGQTCDLIVNELDQVVLGCVETSEERGRGASCNIGAGERCAPGLHCRDSRCVPFCCSHAECGRGGGCDALSSRNGRLGVCEAVDPTPPGPDNPFPPTPPPPECGRSGAVCQFDEVCCSRSCWLGYCT